ncbi:MAG: RusA family crossover junction endodeoxyribonuclease [Leptolyngbya sp. SIO1D8]|nr:RusA family crossover junction endodeoxyribonuclease [Leptolyngbya sp. SIO1D8]
MLSFEFILPGRPVSNQTKDKTRLKAWQANVSQVAAHLWDQEQDCPYEDYVRVQLTYYFEAPSGKEDNVPDSDNVVKPIREALTGIVYLYDYQVTDVISRRRNLNGSFRVKGISPILAEGFIQGVEFVHVKIESAPDPTDLS